MYEPIYLCAHCADDYRKAEIVIDADYDDRNKYICVICKKPYGMAYMVKRDDIIPHCPSCGKVLTKTQTMTAIYLSCRCGYEVRMNT